MQRSQKEQVFTAPLAIDFPVEHHAPLKAGTSKPATSHNHRKRQDHASTDGGKRGYNFNLAYADLPAQQKLRTTKHNGWR